MTAVVVPAYLPEPQIDLKAWEALVDSSLRIADRVDSDDQNLRGELWLMRECRWVYLPFRFRLAYHVLAGSLEIVFFMAQRAGERKWRSMRTVDAYRDVLRQADDVRRVAARR